MVVVIKPRKTKNDTLGYVIKFDWINKLYNKIMSII